MTIVTERKIISKFLIQATENAADREKAMCIEARETHALLQTYCEDNCDLISIKEIHWKTLTKMRLQNPTTILL